MSNIKDLGRIDDKAALEAEFKAAKGKPRGGGIKIRELLVEQRHLPSGKTRFRLLPPGEGLVLPWVRVDEHAIFNETAIETEWKFVSFNCPDRMGKGPCAACQRFIPRLEQSPIPGAKKMGEKAFPKTQLYANVEFTMWGGSEVPEERRGIRPFKFGRGLWRGGDKNQVGGLMALLNDNPNLASVEEGCEIEVEKEGKGLDTTYTVTLVKSKGKVEVAPGRSIEMDIPAFKPLAATSGEIEAKLEARLDLRMFLRMKTPDEMMDLIAKVDPLPESAHVIDVGRVASAPSRQLPPTRPAPAPRRDFRSVQDEIEDDIPFDFDK